MWFMPRADHLQGVKTVARYLIEEVVTCCDCVSAEQKKYKPNIWVRKIIEIVAGL